jgi:Na+/melibiose symporter-like transporter
VRAGFGDGEGEGDEDGVHMAVVLMSVLMLVLMLVLVRLLDERVTATAAAFRGTRDRVRQSVTERDSVGEREIERMCKRGMTA